MPDIKHLIENNKAWAEEQVQKDPDFFKRLVGQQAPEYLWIGCSDSRVPANQIVGMDPGELFVHRNVANQVIQTDFNCLSVIQFAIETLKVRHVLVVGHYGCGGVKAAMESKPHGLVDHWLYPIRDVYREHVDEIAALEESQKVDRLCELNVIEQVRNVCRTNIVQDAWAKGQDLTIHGWVYGLANGHLNDLESVVTCAEEASDTYGIAVKRVFERVAEKS